MEDLCSAIDVILHADLLKVEGEVFNVASGIHRSILSIAQDIIKLMNKDESLVQFVGDRPGQVFRHTGDIRKLQATLDWKPKISWSEGLSRTINWYQENRTWWEKQLWMRAVPIITKSGKRELH